MKFRMACMGLLIILMTCFYTGITAKETEEITTTFAERVDTRLLKGSGFIEPVPLQDVTLEPNSQFDKAVSLNREYLMGIDNDRLLKTFRHAPAITIKKLFTHQHHAGIRNSSTTYFSLFIDVHWFSTRSLSHSVEHWSLLASSRHAGAHFHLQCTSFL